MADKDKNAAPEEEQQEKTTFKGFIMGLLAFTIVILIGFVLVNTALVNLGLLDPKQGIVNHVMAILPFGDKEEDAENAPAFIETEANTTLYKNNGSFGVFIGIDGDIETADLVGSDTDLNDRDIVDDTRFIHKGMSMTADDQIDAPVRIEQFGQFLVLVKSNVGK